MEERLVSAEAIVRYIKSSARLTTPMATLMARIECDLDWLMIQMEREDQDRAVQMEDAWGSAQHVKLVPNYQSIENTPEWRRDNLPEQGF
jgi:hypothetical protein